jgi:3'-phosphoadenosine 5'-phosphosulfate sulfotransferase (PAPS reductase)/FAD synthetase
MVYVSFSGGKDSTVLKHIVDGMYDDVPSLFVNTGLEYPEIQKFAMSQKNVVTVRPKMRFDEVIKKYGYPVASKEVSNTVSGAKNSIRKGQYSLRLCQLGVDKSEYGGIRDDGTHDYKKTIEKSKFTQNKWRFLLDADFDVSEKCCNHIKKAPTKKYEKKTERKPLIATLACESMTREAAWIKKGCNAFNAPRPTSQPMSFWTEQDILHYIKKYDVPYCSVYGDIRVKQTGDDVVKGQINMIDMLECYEEEDVLETTGCDRTGCIFCMFGCHLEKEPNRFQRLKETHPRQYEYCIGGGEYSYKAFKRNESGEWQEFDLAWEYDDGTPMTKQEVERFVQVHSVGFAGQKEEDLWIKFEKRWQPSKEGLGLGKVLDYIGVKYD